MNWVLVAAVAVAVLLALLILWIVLAATRRRAQQARATKRRLAELVGRAQWIHDEGSLEVLGASATPERLQVAWDDIRRRANDVAAHASTLATSVGDEATGDELRHLSHALGRLVGALDTHVSLHMQLSGDPAVRTALEGASETVMERRSDLAAAITPLAARI